MGTCAESLQGAPNRKPGLPRPVAPHHNCLHDSSTHSGSFDPLLQRRRLRLGEATDGVRGLRKPGLLQTQDLAVSWHPVCPAVGPC